MAASFAVENAAGYKSDGSTFAGTGSDNGISQKAVLIRNLVLASEYLMSHITHFYALAALDYVMGPPMSPWVPYFGFGAATTAISANPSGWDAAVSLIQYPSGYQNSFGYYNLYLKPGCIGGFDILGLNGIASAASASYMASGVLAELRDQKTIWSKVIAEYVVSLHMRRRILEVGAQFAGGLPMFRSLVMGGVAVDATSATISSWIDNFRDVLYRGSQAAAGTTASPASGTVLYFIENHYIPTVNIVSYLYPEYDNPNNSGLAALSALGKPSAGQNIGAGYGNFLGYGVFNSHDTSVTTADPESSMVYRTGSAPYSLDDFTVKVTSGKRFHKRGYYISGSYTTSGISASLDHRQIVEVVDYSWYDYYTSAGSVETSGYKHPWSGYTDPVVKTQAYSWAKGPRIWHNYPNTPADLVPMQVGPLARMWVTGLYQGGDAFILPFQHAFLSANGFTGNRSAVTAGHSVMDRHRARALECYLLAIATAQWLEELDNSTILNQDSYTVNNLPSAASGYGIHEAPRGALGHWVVVDSSKRIENWQAVVPSTWIDSPTDFKGNRGPLEESIVNPNTPVSGEQSLDFRKQAVSVPVEVLRVIHSYDPCLACTVHVVERNGEKGVRK